VPEKRRAYIEFKGQRSVVITTAFLQKSFDLKGKDDYAIDLISLNSPEPYNPLSPPSDFFGIISEVDFNPDEYSDDYEPEEVERVDYYIQVLARTSDSRFEDIGLSHLGSRNNVLYRVTLK
jgi:hypothetical protein